MRKQRIVRLLSGAAIALAVMSGTPGLATAETKPADVVPFDPGSVDSFAGAFLAAFTADVAGDYPMAVDLYQTALVFEPDNIRIKERLLLNLLLNGNFDQGVATARELKDDRDFDRVISLVMGLDAIRDGNTKAAEGFFDRDSGNDLDRLMDGLLLAWAQFGGGKQADALATVEKLKGPEWFAIFKNYSAGAMSIAAGDKDAARKYLRDVVSDKMGGATAQDIYLRSVISLAAMEAANGDQQQALDVLAASEEVAGRAGPVEAVREMITAGKAPEQEVKNAVDGAASVLFGISSALNQSAGGGTGPGEIVTVYLQSALALDPNATDTLLVLGNIYDSLDKQAKAIEYYKQIGTESPFHRLSELQLGLDLAQLDKKDEAKERLKALIEEDPQDFRAYLAYGSVLSEAKDYRAMADNFDAAVAAIDGEPSREHWGIFYQRGIAYERLKEWDKAEPSFRKALELYPDQPQVLNYLGYSWIDRNENLDEGMKMISKAVELRPNDGYIVDSLGWAHYRLGQFDEAVENLERAVALMESDPTINDHLGDAYWRVGRKLEATFQWKRALEANTEENSDIDSAELEKKLKEGLPPLNGKAPIVTSETKDGEKKS